MNVFNTGVIFTSIAFILCRKRMGAQWARGKYPKIARNIKKNIDLLWNKNVLKQYEDGIEIRSSRSEVFCKKGVPKTFKKFSEKYLCRSQESLVKVISWESFRIFRNIYFAEHLKAHLREMKLWKNLLTNIFTENYRWWCPLNYSCTA